MCLIREVEKGRDGQQGIGEKTKGEKAYLHLSIRRRTAKAVSKILFNSPVEA
jgi:hypothetical protein